MSDAAAAWRRLLARLAEAGDIITGPLGAQNERERAEGFRHLTRVLSIATEMLVEKGDTRRPAFTRWMSPHRKMLGDNPGTIYDAAMIDGAGTYLISGNRGSCAYLGICVYGTAADGARRIVGNMDDVDLQVADDGSFRLLLGTGADAPEGTPVLALEPDVTDVMVRQYFVDPAREVPATYDITAVPESGPPPALDEATIAARLDALGAYVYDVVEAEATLSALITSITPTQLRGGEEFVDADGNAIEPPIDPAAIARVMPTPAIQYAGSWFTDLGDDEVFIVEGAVPECRYWSISLLSRWMESGDYAHHRVFLSGRDIEQEGGRFRVAIAHDDPGAENWIATTGIVNANVAVRALLADAPLDITFTRERR